MPGVAPSPRFTPAAPAATCARRRAFAWLTGTLLAAALAGAATAAMVSRDTAVQAATGWLVRSPAPMGTPAGRPGAVATYADEQGNALYHVLNLAPAGFVVVAADDEVEPVLAFSSDSKFLGRPGTPLSDLLKHDTRARLLAARRHGQLAVLAVPSRPSPARAKWDELLAVGERGTANGPQALAVADVSDVCVAPMTRSHWDQVYAELPAVPPATDPEPLFIYNYFTPPFYPGHPYNYAAGCSAVSWAQIMRFHQWPKTIGAASYNIGVDGWLYREPMMGGDGQGGAYDWANMPFEPGRDTTPEQMRAIGALMHDAGVGLEARYYYFGTYASIDAAGIKSVFHYAEAKTYLPEAGSDELMKVLRTSLDAGLPANVNIFTADRTGHALVVDGYGYIADTRYHHLNMGWGGHEDAWYNFPPVDVHMGDGSTESFSIISNVQYNIDPEVAGEMITGRITDEEGKPVGGATVTVNTTPARSVPTSPRGIYAFKGLASATAYTLSAAADGWLVSASQPTVTTGNGAADVSTTSNRIVDFRATALGVALSSPQGFGVGAPIVLAVPTSAAQPVAWRRNGARLADTASLSLTLASLQPAQAGLYALELARDAEAIESALAIVGVESTVKVAGDGREVVADVYVAGNGNTFDQILLEGAAASITADYAERQITRLSYVDLDDDIVQVEFSGPGTLTLVLDDPQGPALPANYHQDVRYMKGHAGIVITGATQDSNLAVFSVGKATAANPALFRPEVNYDGIADLAFIAIASRDGRFGGVRAANANFFAARGVTGVYAPGVALAGPLYLGNVTAFDAARPMIRVGAAADVRITGGDLYQDNGRPVRVSGLTRVAFTDGADSHGRLLPAKLNRGVLWDDGVVVTAQLVVNPAAVARPEPRGSGF